MNVSLKKIFNNFLIGIFAVIPIVIVLQIVIFVKDRVADLFGLVYGYADSYLYTSMVFAVSFLLLVLIGHKIVKEGKFWAIAAFDFIIDRIPLLNSIYRVTKKVINMFSSHDRKDAREVVYVEYPKEGLWVPAYVTNKFEDSYILFVPTSPNPTSGFTVIVDKSRVIKSEMNVEEATSFIISVGVDYDKIAEVNKLS
ncbi:MAG: DUF502 domain-containing protein [Methylicorpusculum sp.]|uniref:DUF502 domain-containing protein n=1 Tax=Methylicorpusculum sp. TaxID=2713644 RepID=UPI00272217BF|nr:DUF502 domain-containing protein [Methylicorpusculum sp.]MDO8845154.1 DUF502 domain-containing protein [Methylicorpusculum sp.]MDO8938889.1 DUF502 domain-containing protein [Methylicorpusculum sp.]MDO9240070.1 DUF502 domain-containing protein [Methylicorpusculum sp.]MDP2177989.1 DUF502 domain-containing protein [Methylicorpusculum sp.]MDP2204646.1 DUF502 domain-containing protein [Methylicorpusculum sp.]